MVVVRAQAFETTDQVGILVLPLTSFLSLSELLALSELQFCNL